MALAPSCPSPAGGRSCEKMKHRVIDAKFLLRICGWRVRSQPERELRLTQDQDESLHFDLWWLGWGGCGIKGRLRLVVNRPCIPRFSEMKRMNIRPESPSIIHPRAKEGAGTRSNPANWQLQASHLSATYSSAPASASTYLIV